jgi:hypothetical protein
MWLLAAPMPNSHAENNFRQSLIWRKLLGPISIEDGGPDGAPQQGKVSAIGTSMASAFHAATQVATWLGIDAFAF